ncbi:hypothetical protein [Gordonia caeni]|uniref:PE-PPE domain-containing protein n=1 Tax=Gordonia caeni TaxID=1007097 RepID=A0ABP7NUB8_9ACTN
MATSVTRRNRHRRRKAGALVATGAAAALLAGSLTAPPANAALFPLSLGSIGELPLANVAIATCDAGDPEVDEALLDSAIADCTNSSPWLLTPVADFVLGLVAPDIAELISVGGLNGALATWGPEAGLNVFNPSLGIPGNSTISGNGYSTAITLLGGEATANANYILAGAIALAATGGIANADSLFGVAVASAIGRPATEIGLGPIIEIGSERVENSAKARALPFGIAIANSSLTPAELIAGLGVQVPEYRASSVALGGIAAAYRAIDGSKGAVCTAVYAEARVSEDGERLESCTGVLFIFQKQQTSEGPNAGFVTYAIKNPFDPGLISPYGDGLASLISTITSGAADLGPVNDLLAGKFVPMFKSDIIRIVMTDDGPKFETDLPQWIEGLLDSNSTSGILATGASEAQTLGADAPDAVAASVEESVEAAPLQVNDPAPIPEAVVQETAPLPEMSYNPPPAEEPVVEAPVVEAPQAEEQSAPEPEADTSVQEAPVGGGAGADSAEGADSDADLVLN